jgi:hypothetical protein
MKSLLYLLSYCALCLAIVPICVAGFSPRDARTALRQHGSVVAMLVGLPMLLTALCML